MKTCTALNSPAFLQFSPRDEFACWPEFQELLHCVAAHFKLTEMQHDAEQLIHVLMLQQQTLLDCQDMLKQLMRNN